MHKSEDFKVLIFKSKLKIILNIGEPKGLDGCNDKLHEWKYFNTDLIIDRSKENYEILNIGEPNCLDGCKGLTKSYVRVKILIYQSNWKIILNIGEPKGLGEYTDNLYE